MSNEIQNEMTENMSHAISNQMSNNTSHEISHNTSNEMSNETSNDKSNHSSRNESSNTSPHALLLQFMSLTSSLSTKRQKTEISHINNTSCETSMIVNYRAQNPCMVNTKALSTEYT
jgi:hypothetical protein